jgi:hypothetical protein
VLHSQSRSYSPFGIVLVCPRGTEQRNDSVTHYFVNDAPKGRDVTGELLKTTVNEPFHPFRVSMFSQRGEANDVGEQHRDHPPLVTVDLGGSTLGAESCAGGNVSPAASARHWYPIIDSPSLTRC